MFWVTGTAALGHRHRREHTRVAADAHTGDVVELLVAQPELLDPPTTRRSPLDDTLPAQPVAGPVVAAHLGWAEARTTARVS
jgi:hypothetical protein